MRLSTCDFTFPKLPWEQTIRLGRDLGAEAIDVSLFKDRSHLDPDSVLASPAAWAVRVMSELRANGVGISDVFGQAAAAAEDNALNDPGESVRGRASEFFNRLLDFSAACGAPHLTLLPGVHFPARGPRGLAKKVGTGTCMAGRGHQKCGSDFRHRTPLGFCEPDARPCRAPSANVPRTIPYSRLLPLRVPGDS